MRMRTADPAYLSHVERWWATLFPRMRRHLVENGGPILMVQVGLAWKLCLPAGWLLPCRRFVAGEAQPYCCSRSDRTVS
jgi:hypothetical protein